MVVYNLDVGGLEKVVINLLNNLDKKEFNLFLICLAGEGKLFDEVNIPETCCLILNRKPGIDLDTVFKVREFIVKNNIDVINAHNLSPLIYCGLACVFLKKRPVLMHIEHNLIFRLSTWGKIKFKYFYIRQANIIITVSANLKKYYTDDLKIKRDTRVIYNGIDGEKFSNNIDNNHIKEKLSIADDEFVVGTAVVLSEQKGIQYLIDSAKEVCPIINNIKFLIIGDGPLKNKLQKQVSENNLSDRVIFLGYRKDIPQLISSFDIYVLPSLWEGLPLALLEALALGKPIIATDVGGNPEIVENGVNGYIIPPKNSNAITKKILSIYNNKNSIEEIRLNNIKKFKSAFSLETMVQNYSDLFRQYK